MFTLDDDRSGTLLDVAGGLSQRFETVARREDDLAAILYTSGTTGRSKGAMLSHGNRVQRARAAPVLGLARDDDVLLHMLPIFHVHGLFVASHGALLAGARMIWLPKLDIEQALRYLPRSTVMMGVPTYYVRLLADARFDRKVCAKMRLFISGSAPLLAETFADFKQRSGHAILERYGMSETVMLTSNPYAPGDGERLAGTVGRALPGVQVGWWTMPAWRWRQARSATCRCAVRMCSRATGACRKRRARNSPPTAGSRPATWAAGAANRPGATCRPITCPSSDAART